MKASALFGAGWEHDSVDVLWQDAGRAFCRLGRDGPEGDRHAFIPLLSGAEHPTLESINRLIREYALKDYLDGAWALRSHQGVADQQDAIQVSLKTHQFPQIHHIHQIHRIRPSNKY